MFKKVDPKQSFPKMEEEILKFWEKEKIFEKSVEKNSTDKVFVFYEGPPTANGKPGLHHVLARAFKDIIPRYKTMKGFRVERKAGWDTHGLPVELQVEKALGLKNKQEIENIVPGNPRESIIEFNKKCKESVWEYKDLWEKLTRRMAFWVDMKNPYVTYENKYIESVWWVIAQIFKTKNKKGKSLIYKGHKVVPYCYRCGTALSSHEVAQGYQTVKDNSVYVKFKLKPNQDFSNGKYHTNDSSYILAWTTTPWTLPGNTALAAGEKISYTLLRIKGMPELLIIANDTVEKIFKDQEIEKVHENITGKELIGLEYEPLYTTNSTDKKAYYVIAGDFVTTEDGTGIVHIAPAFGEDDAQAGKTYDLPTLITVGLDGKISADVPGKGIPVKKRNEKNKYAADEIIMEDLGKRKLLFREEIYEHEYPFCWRCDTPLIYYAKPSWFIRTSELTRELVENNNKINWVPEHIKVGRFGEWLAGAKDWAISRERYWGTPLPIWECQGKNQEGGCGHTRAIESFEELKNLSGVAVEDPHKPFIDDIKFKCEKCGSEMKRTPEVMDVWFDSGSMPLAQYHYPNAVTPENKEKIESGKYYPADYICEAVDQTRGWFYTLHAIATLLYFGQKVPAGHSFKNVICLGHILDAKGKKMSKSRGNVIEPMEVMDEYGADILRYLLFTINQPGLPKRFDIKDMKDAMNRVFRMLWNSYYFFVMYANIDKFKVKSQKSKVKSMGNILDRWIISELQMLIKNVDKKLEDYDIYNAAYGIEKFIDNLSNWYIRRSRKRFWKSEDDADKANAYQALYTVLVELSKLMAPFCPFISEEIYRNLKNCHSELVEESNLKNKLDPSTSSPAGESAQDDNCSVHLQDFPVADEKMIDETLNSKMAEIRNIITTTLQLRAKNGIKVRQPLSELRIMNYELSEEFLEIIKEEVNVKMVVQDEKFKEIELDTEITEDLKLEGQAREIIRFIQEMRKEAGYEVDNRIRIGYKGGENIFAKFGSIIAKEALATELKGKLIAESDLQKSIKINKEEIEITIKR